MEFETLSHIHVLTRSEDFAADDFGDAAVFPSVLFAFQDYERRNKALHSIFNRRLNKIFSITLFSDDFQQADDTAWLDSFFLILCHPDYLKTGNFHLVGYTPAPGNVYTLKYFLNWLTQQAKSQGFDIIFIDINQERLTDDYLFNHVKYPYSNPAEEFDGWYLRTLLKSFSVLNIFIADENETLTRLQKEKKLAEKKLFTENFTVFQLLQHIQAEKSQLLKYRQLNGTLQGELTSKTEYMNFIMGKFKKGEGVEGVEYNQAMKIKQFYYNEYEVLPLWFKRVGHILKVIMGKRSFKSLFNDNAKTID